MLVDATTAKINSTRVNWHVNTLRQIALLGDKFTIGGRTDYLNPCYHENLHGLWQQVMEAFP